MEYIVKKKTGAQTSGMRKEVKGGGGLNKGSKLVTKGSSLASRDGTSSSFTPPAKPHMLHREYRSSQKSESKDPPKHNQNTKHHPPQKKPNEGLGGGGGGFRR